jgi:hypothetical protein
LVLRKRNIFRIAKFVYRVQNGLCFAACVAVFAVQSPLLALMVGYDLISRHLLARLPMNVVNSLSMRAFAVAGRHGEE